MVTFYKLLLGNGAFIFSSPRWQLQGQQGRLCLLHASGFMSSFKATWSVILQLLCRPSFAGPFSDIGGDREGEEGAAPSSLAEGGCGGKHAVVAQEHQSWLRLPFSGHLGVLTADVAGGFWVMHSLEPRSLAEGPGEEGPRPLCTPSEGSVFREAVGWCWVSRPHPYRGSSPVW